MSGERTRTGEADQALAVLRDVWSAQGMDGETLAEELGPARSCKRMSDVSFDGMSDPDEDLRTVWRERLKREGKLRPGASGVADLVLGEPEQRG